MKSRAADFSILTDGMLFDYSKTGIDAAARDALLALAEGSGVAEKRAAMFGGAKINDTEGRSVLHVALRAGEAAVIKVDGADVLPEVRGSGVCVRPLPATCARARSRGRVARSPILSTSASAGRTLGPRWPIWRCNPLPTGRAAISSRNVDGRTFTTCCKGLIRKQRW
jgi:glucose-6-phosphate isomerase